MIARVLAFLALIVIPLAGWPAAAIEIVETDPGGEVEIEEVTDAELLDSLFERLSEAESHDEAKLIEEAIWKVWIRSGSPSIDLLMDRGVTAMAHGAYADALLWFDEVVDLAPGYAEGWNKRATLYYLMDDYDASIADIEHVLNLEPRHFGALSGLAQMLYEIGDKKGALAAYRKALAVNPHLEGAGELIDELQLEVEGTPI